MHFIVARSYKKEFEVSKGRELVFKMCLCGYILPWSCASAAPNFRKLIQMTRVSTPSKYTFSLLVFWCSFRSFCLWCRIGLSGLRPSSYAIHSLFTFCSFVTLKWFVFIDCWFLLTSAQGEQQVSNKWATSEQHDNNMNRAVELSWPFWANIAVLCM